MAIGIASISCAQEIDSTYLQIRQASLVLTPTQLGLVNNQSDEVLLVWMDSHYPEGIVSLLIRADGVVSILFSQGGGQLGLGLEPDVAKLGQSILQNAKQYLDKSMLITADVLPSKDAVQWIFHTSNQNVRFEISQDSAMYSELRDLFDQAYELLIIVMNLGN